MLYDILDIYIPTVEMLPKPDPSLFQPAGITYVRSSYDMVEDFGSHFEDYNNALWEICHILGMATDRDFFERDEGYGLLLERNVRCYFKCVNAGGLASRDLSKDIQFVIASVCYYGKYEWIQRLIHRYFSDYEKSEKSGEEMIKMDFSDLYLKIGDICLFNFHNVYSAGQFYSLAATDWDLKPTKESIQFDWDERNCCLTMLATDLFYRSGSLTQEEYRRKYLVDFRYLDDRREYTSDFLEMLMLTYEMNDWEFGVRTEDEINTLDKYLASYKNISSRVIKLDQYGTELRIATSILLNDRWLFYMDCFASLYSDVEAKKQKYKPYVLKAFIENVHHSPLSVALDYVYEKILDFNKWNRIFDFDLSGFDQEYHTILGLSAFTFEVYKCLALLKVNGSRRLAYYTSFESLGHMFWDKENDDSLLSDVDRIRRYGHLSLFHVAYMNDPNEGRILSKYLLGNSQERGEDRKDIRQPYIFIKCFTSLIDDLPMWEMYGDGAKGVCLILDGNFYSVNFVPYDDYPDLLVGRVKKIPVPLYQVCYLKKQKNQYGYSVNQNDNPAISGDKLKELNSRLSAMRKLIEKDKQEWYLKCLEKMRYLFKDSDYCHEQETRILEKRYPDVNCRETECNDKNDVPLIYFKDYDYPQIEEIILGPKFEDRTKKAIYLQNKIDCFYGKNSGQIDLKRPKITLSNVDYR